MVIIRNPKYKDFNMTEDEIKAMYGYKISEIREMVESSDAWQVLGTRGAALFTISMMQAAQDEMKAGRAEQAEQTLNRAKWVLSNYVIGFPDDSQPTSDQTH